MYVQAKSSKSHSLLHSSMRELVSHDSLPLPLPLPSLPTPLYFLRAIRPFTPNSHAETMNHGYKIQLRLVSLTRDCMAASSKVLGKVLVCPRSQSWYYLQLWVTFDGLWLILISPLRRLTILWVLLLVELGYHWILKRYPDVEVFTIYMGMGTWLFSGIVTCHSLRAFGN
ncbi:hypothetical protein BDR22DRAFT_643657 [Usnea florida]